MFKTTNTFQLVQIHIMAGISQRIKRDRRSGRSARSRRRVPANRRIQCHNAALQGAARRPEKGPLRRNRPHAKPLRSDFRSRSGETQLRESLSGLGKGAGQLPASGCRSEPESSRGGKTTAQHDDEEPAKRRRKERVCKSTAKDEQTAAVTLRNIVAGCECAPSVLCGVQ